MTEQLNLTEQNHSNEKSQEELKSFLMRVKEESEKAGLGLAGPACTSISATDELGDLGQVPQPPWDLVSLL